MPRTPIVTERPDQREMTSVENVERKDTGNEIVTQKVPKMIRINHRSIVVIAKGAIIQ